MTVRSESPLERAVRKATPERERGEDHLLEVLYRILCERCITRCREDSEVNGEHEDQYQPQPEVGYGEAEKGHAAADVVGHPPPPHGRHDPRRQAYADADKDAEQGQLESDRQFAQYDPGHIQAGADRFTEVAPEGIAHPPYVLNREGPVETVLDPDLLERLLAALLAGEREGRITRECVDPREDNDRSYEQNEQ